MNPALIIFIRNPELGKVKTRLAATLGDEKALEIYKTLLQHTRETAEKLDIKKYLFYHDLINKNDDWSNEVFDKQLQIGNDLGEKMFHAFDYLFLSEFDQVLIIGSDCPELNEGIIGEAFRLLIENDVVVGPASDGGYYLLGMNKMHASLFQNIQWSTGSVFNETINACSASGLTYALLPTLTDIDVEADLNKPSVKTFLNSQTNH